MKRFTLLSVKSYGLIALITLCGCSGYTPKPNLNKTYHAPMQAYDLDLTTQVFRGKVSIKDSCTIAGSSTDIIDSEGQFFRIDTVNLVNNPKLELPDFAEDATVTELVLLYYTDTVNTGGKLLDQSRFNTTLGAAQYAVMQLPTPKPQYLGYLIVRRGNFAYAFQHVQTVFRPEKMKERLAVLTTKVRIPGTLPKNKTQSDNPIYIDMKNATPREILQWQKQADCQ